jgi:dGTPase
LEAQVAAISDDIAYDDHDIDDGLRAGLFSLEQLLEVPLVARSWEIVRRRYPEVDASRLPAELVREQIGLMVNDVLEETRRRIGNRRPDSASDVRNADGALAGFSEEMSREERALKSFLYANMYRSPPVRAVAREAKQVLAGLFAAYLRQPSLLPEGWRPEAGGVPERTIGDFVAGMTDRFAIAQYRAHVGPVQLPEAF